MKFKLLIILLLTTFICGLNSVSFGIVNGSGSSTTFNFNNIIFGLDVRTLGLDAEIINEDWIWNGNDYIVIENTEEVSLSACLLMPRIGLRRDLKSIDKLNTYYQGEIYLTIPFISIDGGDSSEENQIESNVSEVTDMVGFKAIYGVEYKFNEQLSFTMATGFNFLINNLEIEDTNLNARLGNSFTDLSINFSF